MIEPIKIDLSGLKGQFGLDDKTVDQLTETCVNKVTALIKQRWEAEAKRGLHSTLPVYLQNLNQIDKGRFNKMIILTGELPNMIEQGASPFDMKEGFKKSKWVKYTVPVYNRNGKQIRKGGDWYLTIPFRQGTPGIVGQAGFANEMPQEIYAVMVHRNPGVPLTAREIPEPYDVPRSRAAIIDEKTNQTLYAEYQHKSSIYEGLTKYAAAYQQVVQNTYKSFRRAGENSDPLSWIHKGIKPHNFAEKAVQGTDVEQIVENEVLQFLDTALS